VLVAEDGRVEVKRYWQLDPGAESEPDPDRLWELLAEAVELRLVADVPVGSFLSGGIDSSSIVAAATEHRGPPDTFTVTFPRPEERLYDERDDARAIAAAFGTSHHELEVRADARELLPELVRHFDEPFGNPTALLVYELSRLTRRHVKVALAGDGADELFAGYPRFRGLAAASWYRRVPGPVRVLAAAGARAVPESTRGRHSLRRAREFALAPLDSLESAYLSWITYFDAQRRASLLAPDVQERLRESPPPERFVLDLFDRAPRGDVVNRLSFVELQSFLPCNVLEYGDRMSMAHGLEVRAPFTDHRLVEHVFSLPGSSKLRRGRAKAILRAAAASHLPPRPLAKRKIGFNPPMGVWLNRELAPLVDSHLSREQVEARALFRADEVERLVGELRSGRRDVSLHVWSLIVLEQWLREYA
jgi:asparagine synthase (glutamine-hydrolysing)